MRGKILTRSPRRGALRTEALAFATTSAFKSAAAGVEGRSTLRPARGRRALQLTGSRRRRRRALRVEALAFASTATFKSAAAGAEGRTALKAALRRRALRLTWPRRGRGALRTGTSAAAATTTFGATTALTTATARTFAIRRRALRTATGARLTTLRGLRAQFLLIDFAVVVLVERQESLGGIGDLFFVNLAVLVGVECSDDGRHHGTELAAAAATRLAGLTRLSTATGRRLGRCGLARRSRRFRCRRFGRFLREQRACGRESAQQGIFGDEVHWFGVVGFDLNTSSRSQKNAALMQE